MWDLTVDGGHLVLPEIGVIRADVAIQGGRIAAVGLRLGKGRETIDARGKVVFPGVVDPHIHLGLQNSFASEALTETASGLAGGVTTVGIFLRSLDEPYAPQLHRIREEYESNAMADGFFHLQIFNDTHLGELKDDVLFGVTSFKFYLCGLPNVMPAVDDGFLLEGFRCVAALGPGAIACVHAENEAMVVRAMAKVRREKPNGTLADWAESRPAEAEAEAVNRAAFLAEWVGCRIYIVHLCTRQALATARTLRATGQVLHLEATSAHLSMNKYDSIGPLGKMSPPLREPEDVESLWRAVGDGTIDSVGTDNTSFTRAGKRLDDGIYDAVPGGPALATHLPTLLEQGFHRRGISLKTIAEIACAGPAKIFGLYPRKGTIAVGSDADLVVVDIERERVVRASELHSFSDFSLLENRSIRGWPVAVIKGGRVAVYENEILVSSGTGHYLGRPITRSH